jgi:hypothetical protein
MVVIKKPNYKNSSIVNRKQSVNFSVKFSALLMVVLVSGLISIAAVAPASAVDTSTMDVVFSDTFDDLSNWNNPQGLWVPGTSPSGFGTDNVAYIDLTNPGVIGKNKPQNLISTAPIDLTGYTTVILQFDSCGISTKRGNQKENVVVTDEHGVQHIVWAKSKATFTGLQQIDISNYVAGNESITLTFQYVKKGPAKDSRWEIDNLKVLGCTTSTMPYRTIQFNSSAYSVTEADGTYAVLNLTCEPACQGTVTVNWTANDGTALAGINYGTKGDYSDVDVTGMVTFNDGDTYKLIQIPILNDLHYSSPDLTFNVSIEDVTDATENTIPGTPYEAEVTILDSNSDLSPVVAIDSLSPSINEGSSWSGSGSFTEPGAGTSWTATVNYGDGTGVQDLTLTDKTFVLSHTYADNDDYTVTVTVKNNNEISGSDYYDVTVNSVAPTATFNTNSPVNEGSDIVVSLTSPSDPSTADTTAGFTYAFDFGSGYGEFSTSNTASITAADDGVVTVNGKIMDKDGYATEYTADVTVNKVTHSYTYNLVSGWNLISVPLDVTDDSVSGFFPADVLSGIEVIWGWDESAQDWVLYAPDPNEPFYGEPYNYPHLTNIETGRAYWVYSDNSVSFTVDGYIPDSAPASPVSLVSGWNFVGITGLDSQNVVTMYPGTGVVWGWDESAQDWVLYAPDPNEPFYGEPYNYPHLTNVLPGHGYWVYMDVF